MYKLKTKSAAKKRFKITGTGRVLYKKSKKRHNLVKRSSDMKRDARKSSVLSQSETKKIFSYLCQE